ncbi:ClpX C4-type zinc finger protein [Flavobacterium sp.]|jgi:hypothetical protein|uniref:ClpX C4-type zinc finger protein n=1 Tax=Flavobacterium sp. TaxID=239 RepID=UPI0037C10556
MTAKIIPFNPPKRLERKCSFCQKDESKVKLLWESESTGKCVCNECIVKCKTLIDEDTETKPT